MEKIRVEEVIVVEGKYDAAALSSLVDGLIITTDGYSIFSDNEKKELLRELGKKRGLILLTDSDAAGFSIRNYVEKIVGKGLIKHAYVPALAGKERRKNKPGKEGVLGVEGMSRQVLYTALQEAGTTTRGAKQGSEITYTDLYLWGLSGGEGSAETRRSVLQRLGLPVRLSKRALRDVLNSLYTREEFEAVISAKPVLFWDFHGTLTLPDVSWFGAAMDAAAECVPEHPLRKEVLLQHFSRTCLPWYTVPGGDTRHLTGENWWQHSETEFTAMFQKCGFTRAQAQKISSAMRKEVLRPHRYTLYPDALETLAALQKRGYTSYILSNNFPELSVLVQKLGLSPYIQAVLVSGEIGYDKPHKEIFKAARKAAQNPEEVWMIGDNPLDDIEGGRAAGFTTVHVHGGQSGPAQYCVPELKGLLEILK